MKLALILAALIALVCIALLLSGCANTCAPGTTFNADANNAEAFCATDPSGAVECGLTPAVIQARCGK